MAGRQLPLRNLLSDTLMGSCPIEILNVSKQDTMQMFLVEDQHVIQALSPDTPQKAFTDRIGSWRVIGRFHNATDYFLFFGTKHLDGLKKMKNAMCSVDPTGPYEFSDFTNRSQLLLFSRPDYSLLKQTQVNRFRGFTASIEDIERFVIAETPFCKYKTEVLKPMELSSPPEIRVLAVDPKRRRGTFANPKTLIEFL